MVHGKPPGRDSWTIELAHPRGRQTPILRLEIASGSVATTADSEQPGHVLDPRTGAAVNYAGSVVVWHARGLVADILSTALFVMGPKAGGDWAEAREIAACFLESREDGVAVFPTREFTRMFGVPGGTIAPGTTTVSSRLSGPSR
jgi:thiamine biosynthesis lipoprotein